MHGNWILLYTSIGKLFKSLQMGIAYSCLLMGNGSYQKSQQCALIQQQFCHGVSWGLFCAMPNTKKAIAHQARVLGAARRTTLRPGLMDMHAEMQVDQRLK